MSIVSKRRVVDKETGETVEDWDLVFADDKREANPTSFKFLQMAHAWKTYQAAKNAAAGGGSSVLSGFMAATTAQKDDDASSEVASSHGSDMSEWRWKQGE
ncbi:hypothetical protein DXG03_000515 [Asterophora parasitica]|uniref:Uncharacterized protein n=1 Tax=Asterophora parasitica TaxID=117018 RepID=A0A9P7G407_9AGAR|nr:hypothetical protein DXG03_000515 [Asterophora parasitica]